ncbi:NRDE family protein [Rhodocytophaga rosea]|uniref:NRDE family protein n=1 Tax=Rhodocytophaga rosea TaxID=2704465 RepID=A0A6C0GNY3_9BACT|nr:NRDE family protein [Rhodocytophaga rosea]QHT69736.1 NRDE family protein [Rhodocytophaga rosea]
MCTLTYLPITNKGFILTSSRDERTSRRTALTPQTNLIGAQMIIYPKDAQGGGTWIAASATRTVCLLNGAFKPHRSLAPYKHSRGKVVLALFEYDSIHSFVTQYDFKGIEPFTLIVIENDVLYELRWNGTRYYFKTLDAAIPHIWSSVTLYNPQVRSRRKSWFTKWLLSADEYSVDSIRLFHKTAGAEDPLNSFVMNRNNDVRTVSLTSIVRKEQEVEMIYEDLLRQQTHRVLLQERMQVLER